MRKDFKKTYKYKSGNKTSFGSITYLLKIK